MWMVDSLKLYIPSASLIRQAINTQLSTFNHQLLMKLYLGTRKGLIEAERSAAGWKLGRNSFLGVQVPMLLPDARDGTLYAAVVHGHFGTKFHASCDGGATWEERVCPA